MKNLVLLPAALLLAFFVSCDKSEDNETTNYEETVDGSADSFAVEPSVVAMPLELTKAQEGYIAADNTFAINLLSKMDSLSADEGYFFSPISISTALSMLLNGTQGETAREIIDALGYGDNIDAVNDYWHQILSKSASWDTSVTLSIANALVSNKNKVKQSYSYILESEYLAEVSSFDFSNPSPVLDYINGWCNEKTHGMIPRILNQLSPSDVLCILNAMYFKGGWSIPFREENTVDAKFTKDNGGIVDIRMMKKISELNYCSLDEMSLLELPYGNGSFAFQVLLPEFGASDRALAEIKKTGWNELFAGLTEDKVDVSIPKFKVEQSSPYDMCPIVNDLAMRRIFFPSSDFLPMTEEKGAVSSILHKTALTLDEEGSEASAVTAIIWATAVPGYVPSSSCKVFLADHPFYYAIVDKVNGLILFMGKYNG